MYSNRQSAANKLSNEQYQVLLTGKFGDGCLYRRKGLNTNFMYVTNSIHKDIVEFKYKLLGNLKPKASIRGSINRGYKPNMIYTFVSKTHPLITQFANEDWKDSLENMNDLGLALWFYDDGSLHKKGLFYNLNTQKFSRDDNIYIAEYFQRKWKIKAIPTIERKKDGREFWYLRIRKFEGAFKISEIMRKYYLPCYSYKLISSETIQRWSKLQEELKSSDKVDYTARELSIMLKNTTL